MNPLALHLRKTTRVAVKTTGRLALRVEASASATTTDIITDTTTVGQEDISITATARRANPENQARTLMRECRHVLETRLVHPNEEYFWFDDLMTLLESEQSWQARCPEPEEKFLSQHNFVRL